MSERTDLFVQLTSRSCFFYQIIINIDHGIQKVQLLLQKVLIHYI